MDLSLEEFILKYHNYAKLWANYYCKLYDSWSLEFEDLYQVGCLKLVECYSKYDNNKSSSSTYAFLSIKFGILNYIKKNSCIVEVPDDLVIISSDLNRKIIDFYKDYGKNMSIEEMIVYIKNELFSTKHIINEEHVRLLLKIQKLYLLKEKYSFDGVIKTNCKYCYKREDVSDKLYIKDLIPNNSNVEDTAIMNYQVCEILRYVEDNFENMDVDIFKETFGLIDSVAKSGRTLAKKYDMTHQAINLRYHKVLKKVKEKFSNLE